MPRPIARAGEAVIRITTTTICGTDVHIVRGEYPVTTLCPGGKERMRRLMTMIEHGRVDLRPLVTHEFALDDIGEAFDLFSRQQDGVLKVALHPHLAKTRAGRMREHVAISG